MKAKKAIVGMLIKAYRKKLLHLEAELRVVDQTEEKLKAIAKLKGTISKWEIIHNNAK